MNKKICTVISSLIKSPYLGSHMPYPQLTTKLPPKTMHIYISVHIRFDSTTYIYIFIGFAHMWRWRFVDLPRTVPFSYFLLVNVSTNVTGGLKDIKPKPRKKRKWNIVSFVSHINWVWFVFQIVNIYMILRLRLPLLLF